MEDAIEQISREMSTAYKDADENDPMYAKVKFLSMIIQPRLWVLHALWSSKCIGFAEWNKTRKRGLASAASLLEVYNTVMTQLNSEQAYWHVKRHMQLHATLHILDELCRTDSTQVSADVIEVCHRAWKAVEHHPPKEVLDALHESAAEAEAHDSSREIVRVWGYVGRLKDQARARWAPSSNGNFGLSTYDAFSTPGSSELDWTGLQFPSQFDPMDFTTLASTDDLDYFALCEGLDISVGGFGGQYMSAAPEAWTSPPN